MNWLVRTLALLVASASHQQVQDTAPEQPTCDRTRTIRVLFIGNSLSYVNNMPNQVATVAAALPGPCIESGMIAIGGATLRLHWSADSTVRRIRTGGWTHVVLNDQSSFGEQWFLNGKPRVGTSGTEFAEFSKRFVNEIKAAGAKPIILAHWSDNGAPVRDQQALDYAFAQAARSTGSTIAPAGEAVKRMQAALPALTPYNPDGRHLSMAGSYLEALVIYATLTDRTPVGAVRRINGPAVEFNQGTVFPDSIVTLTDLPDSVATVLQRLAATVNTERRGQMGGVVAPASLAAEYPKLPAKSDPAVAESLIGRWRGVSDVLPNPGNRPVDVEVVRQPASLRSATGDSIHIKISPIEYSGPIDWSIEGNQVVLRGSVTPKARVGRAGPPLPFSIELRAVLVDGALSGIAHMHQPMSESVPSSFDAVGRVELKRAAPPSGS